MPGVIVHGGKCGWAIVALGRSTWGTIMLGPARNLFESQASVAVPGGGSWVASRRSSPLAVLAGIVFAASAMMCGPASADVVTTKCRAPLSSIVKTKFNDAFVT